MVGSSNLAYQYRTFSVKFLNWMERLIQSSTLRGQCSNTTRNGIPLRTYYWPNWASGSTKFDTRTERHCRCLPPHQILYSSPKQGSDWAASSENIGRATVGWSSTV